MRLNQWRSRSWRTAAEFLTYRILPRICFASSITSFYETNPQQCIEFSDTKRRRWPSIKAPRWGRRLAATLQFQCWNSQSQLLLQFIVTIWTNQLRDSRRSELEKLWHFNPRWSTVKHLILYTYRAALCTAAEVIKDSKRVCGEGDHLIIIWWCVSR